MDLVVAALSSASAGISAQSYNFPDYTLAKD